MVDRIKFTKEFWHEWQQDPKGTAKKYGINWADLDQDWQQKDWLNVSWDEFDRMWRKSRWSSWIDW